jgi:hypothetical protein
MYDVGGKTSIKEMILVGKLEIKKLLDTAKCRTNCMEQSISSSFNK